MEAESKRLKEVFEILKYFPEDDIDKIPNDIFEYINSNKDDTYEYRFDSSKKIYEQDVHPDTIALLIYICKNYIFNGNQKEFLDRLEQIDIAQNYKKNNLAEYNKQMFGNKK